MVGFLFWLMLAAGVGALASSRGRSGFAFFLLAVLLSPLIGLVVVLVMDDLTKKAEAERLAQRDHERRLAEVKALTARPPAQPVAPPSRPAATGSTADELSKLADLRDRGVLTEEEFLHQKTSMLAGYKQVNTLAPTFASPTAPAARAVAEVYGVCPNCDRTIPLSSAECPHCRVDFGPGSASAIKRLG